jgi:AraC-like DNA-binding protein
MNAAGAPCYAAFLVRPFIQLLSQNPAFRANPLTIAPPGVDERIPISQAHDLLNAAVQITGDPYLGLKAGRTVSPGDAGVADYAVSSAPTVEAAIEVAARYMRLVNDALELRLALEGSRAVLRLESRVVMPSAAEDFLSSSLYTSHMRSLLQGAPDLECWFVHAAPGSPVEYQSTFGRAILRFGAPCTGYSFDSRHLAASIASGDPKLHRIVRQHGDALLAELPVLGSLTDRVRRHLVAELPGGNPTASHVAIRLHMSARTLGRGLEREGTTFTEVLDDLRKRSGVHHVGRGELSLSEIAFLLGFSHVVAFHRAFKRWTGATPLAYRRAAQAAKLVSSSSSE